MTGHVIARSLARFLHSYMTSTASRLRKVGLDRVRSGIGGTEIRLGIDEGVPDEVLELWEESLMMRRISERMPGWANQRASII